MRMVTAIDGPGRRRTTRRAARACGSGIALLAASGAATAQAAPAERTAELRSALTRAIEDEMRRCALPGLAIAIADRATVVWAQGFGVDGPARKAAVVPEALFRVASISKLFTATAVMRAVERGEIDLDADVTTYVAGTRPRGFPDRDLTLRLLLTHSAGLLREPPIGNYFDLEPPALEAVVASLAETDLVAAPGAMFKYSNAGVALAGRVLEARAGAPFAALVERDLLRPLGLTRATFRGNGRDEVMQGIMWTYDGRAIPTPRADLGLGPAANLCASMPDLVRFAQTWFLGEHRQPHALLQEATLRAMFAPQTTAPVGLGFFLGRLDGRLQVSHGGAYYGVASLVAALPEEGIAVALATTVDFASGPVERLAQRALRAVLALRGGDALPEPTPALAPLGAARARRLAGTYGEGPARIELVANGDHLWLRPRAGEWMCLSATAQEGVLVAADRATTWQEIEVDDDAGALTLAGVRLPRSLAMPPPCPAHLLPLLGEYGWDHDVLLVFEREGALAILIEWLAEYPLQEVDAAAGHFALDRARGLYCAEDVHFVRDAAGAVSAVRVGAVTFPRRPLLGVDGGRFRIAPRYPKERLLAMARAARAPAPAADARSFDLVELRELDDSIRYDIRYAGSDNFLGFALYEHAQAKLQRPAAEALVRVHRVLAAQGLGLLIHDAYRPWLVTKMFFDATPEAQRHFVADPSLGSRHNRGCAVDLTLCDRTTGAPVAMPSLYDEFTPRAYPGYPGGTGRQRYYRELLRAAMAAENFAVYEFEWWHFDHHDWEHYPVK